MSTLQRTASRLRAGRGRRTLLVTAFLALGIAAPASAATLNVSKSGADTPGCGPTTPCATIQQAVTNAAANDTIQVAAGRYIEQVDLTSGTSSGGSRPVTVNGAGTSLTIIEAPDVLTPKGALGHRPIVFVGPAAAGSTISNLQVDGAGKGSFKINPTDLIPTVNDLIEGISFQDAGGTVRRVRVTRVRDTPVGDQPRGDGIFANNADSTPRTITINQSRIDDFQQNAINLGGAGLTANVTNNIITGAGPILNAQHGIQLTSGATGTVSGNQISAISSCNGVRVPRCDPPNPAIRSTAAGIILLAPGANVTVSGNTIEGGDAAIYAQKAPSVDILANRISGAGQYGIRVLNGSGGADEVASAVNVRGNSITDQDFGIYLSDADPAAAPDVTATININRLVGNGVGVFTDTAAAQDARNNWWGCNTGPDTGACDSTSGNLTSAPFLVFRATASPASIPVGGAQSAIRGRVDGDNTGAGVDTTEFPASPVDFTATKGSIDPTATTLGGIAASDLRSDDTIGTSNVTATFDGQPATTSVDFAAAGSGLGLPGPPGPPGPPGAPGSPAGGGGGVVQPSSAVLRILRPRGFARVSRGRIALRVRCVGLSKNICAGRLVIRRGKTDLGRQSFRFRGGKTITVRVRLTVKGRKVLRKAGLKRKINVVAFVDRGVAGTKAVTARSTLVRFKERGFGRGAKRFR